MGDTMKRKTRKQRKDNAVEHKAFEKFIIEQARRCGKTGALKALEESTKAVINTK